MGEGLRLIDLAEDQLGSDCVIHLAMGVRGPAHFVDRLQGPVCEDCFIDLINLEAKLAFHNYQEGINEAA